MSDDDGENTALPWPPAANRHATIIDRLYRAFDHKMREVEARISTGSEGLSPADSERDARTLNSLARLFEKLTDLEGADKNSGKGKGISDLNAEEIDAEGFRRDIADRLEKLLKSEQG